MTMLYSIDPERVRDLAREGRRALAGDSNDAEHDALFWLMGLIEDLELQTESAAKCSAEAQRDP